jgi:hypothetical protein
MVFGMSLHHYTQLHVLICVLALASGAVAALGMLAGKTLPNTTAFFLTTTVLTSVTGILFPWKGFTPGVVVGIISLVVLLIAILARYGSHLHGHCRRIYVITAMIALWLNYFVLIAQLFEHCPKLHALAPTGTEPPFKIAQTILLVIFIVWAIAADKKFHPATT